MSAIISACGTYRYRLERKLEGRGPTVMFLMVNPSTADAETDDATIRKCAGFANRLSAHYMLVGNKFAYRATDIKALRGVADPVGPDNDKHLDDMLVDAEIVIAAWGSLNKIPETLRSRWKDVVRLADQHKHKLRTIGVCADGHPKHPLMVGYDAPIKVWDVPWFPNRTPITDEELAQDLRGVGG